VKKLMFLTGILAFLMLSCMEPEADYIVYIDNIVYETFSAQNLKTEAFYGTPAGKYAIGKYCTLWIEAGTALSRDDAKKIINEFDNNIYPKMTAVFGTNCLNAVDIDDDGKLCIFLLDIKDSYQPGVNESAVQGYFDYWDILDSDANQRDMIYIDTYPGKPGSADSNMTLAHEMQHLMNFGYAVIRANYNPNDIITSMMDVWIDEGLSCAAEWIYSGSHPTSRWGWYHNNGNGRTGSARIQSDIDKGNNFYVWGNRASNIYAELDDYATAYLFFQWLRIQSNNSSGIYRDIISSSYPNFRAVTSAAASRISSDYNNNNWSTLLRDWLAANYINSATSRYGYKNDSTLRALNKHFYTASGTTPLWPGEGVFSKINIGFNVPADSGNLKYYNLTSTDPVKTQINSGALLSYNDNTTITGSSANGTVTGVASVSVDVSVNGRFIAAPVTLSGPYWVSGGDVLRRNGRARDSSSGVPRSSRITANE